MKKNRILAILALGVMSTGRIEAYLDRTTINTIINTINNRISLPGTIYMADVRVKYVQDLKSFEINRIDEGRLEELSKLFKEKGWTDAYNGMEEQIKRREGYCNEAGRKIANKEESEDFLMEEQRRKAEAVAEDQQKRNRERAQDQKSTIHNYSIAERERIINGRKSEVERLCSDFFTRKEALSLTEMEGQLSKINSLISDTTPIYKEYGRHIVSRVFEQGENLNEVAGVNNRLNELQSEVNTAIAEKKIENMRKEGQNKANNLQNDGDLVEALNQVNEYGARKKLQRQSSQEKTESIPSDMGKEGENKGDGPKKDGDLEEVPNQVNAYTTEKQSQRQSLQEKKDSPPSDIRFFDEESLSSLDTAASDDEIQEPKEQHIQEPSSGKKTSAMELLKTKIAKKKAQKKESKIKAQTLSKKTFKEDDTQEIALDTSEASLKNSMGKSTSNPNIQQRDETEDTTDSEAFMSELDGILESKKRGNARKLYMNKALPSLLPKLLKNVEGEDKSLCIQSLMDSMKQEGLGDSVIRNHVHKAVTPSLDKENLRIYTAMNTFAEVCRNNGMKNLALWIPGDNVSEYIKNISQKISSMTEKKALETLRFFNTNEGKILQKEYPTKLLNPLLLCTKALSSMGIREKDLQKKNLGELILDKIVIQLQKIKKLSDQTKNNPKDTTIKANLAKQEKTYKTQVAKILPLMEEKFFISKLDKTTRHSLDRSLRIYTSKDTDTAKKTINPKIREKNTQNTVKQRNANSVEPQEQRERLRPTPKGQRKSKEVAPQEKRTNRLREVQPQD